MEVNALDKSMFFEGAKMLRTRFASTELGNLCAVALRLSEAMSAFNAEEMTVEEYEAATVRTSEAADALRLFGIRVWGAKSVENAAAEVLRSSEQAALWAKEWRRNEEENKRRIAAVAQATKDAEASVARLAEEQRKRDEAEARRIRELLARPVPLIG